MCGTRAQSTESCGQAASSGPLCSRLAYSLCYVKLIVPLPSHLSNVGVCGSILLQHISYAAYMGYENRWSYKARVEKKISCSKQKQMIHNSKTSK